MCSASVTPPTPSSRLNLSLEPWKQQTLQLLGDLRLACTQTHTFSKTEAAFGAFWSCAPDLRSALQEPRPNYFWLPCSPRAPSYRASVLSSSSSEPLSSPLQADTRAAAHLCGPKQRVRLESAFKLDLVVKLDLVYKKKRPLPAAIMAMPMAPIAAMPMGFILLAASLYDCIGTNHTSCGHDLAGC